MEERTSSEVLEISTDLLERDPNSAFQKILHLLSTHHETGCCTHESCSNWRDSRAYLLSGPYEDIVVKLLDKMENFEYMESYNTQITAVLSNGPLDVTLEVGKPTSHSATLMIMLYKPCVFPIL